MTTYSIIDTNNMSITNITITNDDGTTQVFVPEVPVKVPLTVSVPLGVAVILEADTTPTA